MEYKRQEKLGREWGMGPSARTPSPVILTPSNRRAGEPAPGRLTTIKEERRGQSPLCKSSGSSCRGRNKGPLSGTFSDLLLECPANRLCSSSTQIPPLSRKKRAKICRELWKIQYETLENAYLKKMYPSTINNSLTAELKKLINSSISIFITYSKLIQSKMTRN